MPNKFRNETYRSSKIYSYLVMACLGSILVCVVLFAIGCVIMLVLPDMLVDLDSGLNANLGLLLIGFASLPYTPVYILTVVLFLMWVYRSYRNLSPLKARNLEFSPGWAVGWWFVPLANFVKPFQIIRELWNESDPDFDEDLGYMPSSLDTPETVGFWWAAFLISGFAFRISDRMVENDGSVNKYFPVAFLVASIINAAAAILAILIVKTITERQEERFRKIDQKKLEPPEPPVFE